MLRSIGILGSAIFAAAGQGLLVLAADPDADHYKTVAAACAAMFGVAVALGRFVQVLYDRIIAKADSRNTTLELALEKAREREEKQAAKIAQLEAELSQQAVKISQLEAALEKCRNPKGGNDD